MALTWSAKCPKCGVPNEGGPFGCGNCDSLDVYLVSGPGVNVACRACAVSAPFQLACGECGTRLENLVARNASEAWEKSEGRKEEWRNHRREEWKEVGLTVLVILGVPLVLFVLALIVHWLT